MKDGVINIAAKGDRMFRDLLRVVGATELGDDPRFATARARTLPAMELLVHGQGSRLPHVLGPDFDGAGCITANAGVAASGELPGVGWVRRGRADS